MTEVERLRCLDIKIIQLQWFQRCHDRNYHRDVYFMPTMKRLQHLHNHLVKYGNRQFSELDWDNPVKLFADALACIFGMSDALNIRIKAEDTDLFYKVKPKYDALATIHHYHETLGKMAKLLEGWDHLEDLNYRTDLTECINNLFHLVCQMWCCGVHGIKVKRHSYEDEMITLLKGWFDRLNNIQSKHVFHDYIVSEQKGNETYWYVRDRLGKCSLPDLVEWKP